jgi:hypothetical protein
VPKRLREDQVERFARDGVIFPVPVYDPFKIGERLDRLEAIERARAGRLPPAMNAKPHLLIPWLWDMVHDPRIVDAVEDLIGPDILCFGTSFISKSGSDDRYISWHQDATHWGLSEPRAVTAWVAFTASRRDNGCVRAIPGSHLRVVAHGHEVNTQNMLGRREFVLDGVDEAAAVDVELEAGEMSLHHALAIHGSLPNRSGRRRTGFAIRYFSGGVRQTKGRRNFATLVRGRDYGDFDLEIAPEGEFHPAAVTRHRTILRRGIDIIFDGARENVAG